MRFSEIKESAYENVGEDAFLESKYLDILKKYMDNGQFIYRGMRGSSVVILGDGNQMTRKARNTKNYINLLVDNVIEGWQNFPTRSKSFICSNDISSASGYGSLFYVIPLENQPIAAAGAEDFWEAFSGKLFGFDATYREPTVGVQNTNRVIEQLSWLLFNDNKGPDDENPQALVEYLNKIDKELKTKNIQELAEIKTELAHKGKEIFEKFLEDGILLSLGKWFTPLNTKMELFKSFNSYIQPKNEQELWMSGKVLFVKKVYVDELKERGIL